MLEIITLTDGVGMLDLLTLSGNVAWRLFEITTHGENTFPGLGYLMKNIC